MLFSRGFHKTFPHLNKIRSLELIALDMYKKRLQNHYLVFLHKHFIASEKLPLLWCVTTQIFYMFRSIHSKCLTTAHKLPWNVQTKMNATKRQEQGI